MSDANTATETEQNAPSPKRAALLRLLVAAVVLVLLLWGLWYLLEGRWYADTDDAYVDGNIVQITPKVAGTVVSIGADDGDLVYAGQTLVTLDPSDTSVALDIAKAQLAQAVRQVRGLFNNVEGGKAEVKAREVALAKAQSDYQRRKGLAESGAISAEILAHAQDELAAAKSALITAQQRYHSAKALVGNTDVSSNPAVKTAEAKLQAAYLNSVHSRIIAPVDGYIAKRSVQVGEQVAPGRALMAVVPLHHVWVEANFKETQLEKMRIGQPVELTSDLYGSSVTYHGKVEAIGVGTGSVFSLLPAENATGNWIKIVQRLPVRISLDLDELEKHPLRVGLSMKASVDLHDHSGHVLSQQPPTKPVFATSVFERQLADAQTLINQIIEANLDRTNR